MKHHKYTNQLKASQMVFAEVVHYLTEDKKTRFTFSFHYNKSGIYDILILDMPSGLISFPNAQKPLLERTPLGKIPFESNQSVLSLDEAKTYAKVWAEHVWKFIQDWKLITNEK